MIDFNSYVRSEMESLTEYTDDTLITLEGKVRLYLALERDIRLLDVELLSLQSMKSDFDPEQEDLELEIQEGHQIKTLNDKEQLLAEMIARYEIIKSEVIQLLPEQNKFVELNLDSGPTKVGYFTIDLLTNDKLPEPVLRIVY
jgi:hypothetical protein